MTGAEAFLNPYTFVPAFPRGAGLPDALADRRPPRRDRLHPDRWTGRIGVTLTVDTPLLLLDTARHHPADKGDPSHKVYPVRLRDGRPHLPATSVKGMIRAAFEAVTNSRFGVFENHDEPLAFRRTADFALRLVPVWVGDRALVRCRTARLEMYDKSGKSVHARGGRDAPQHMDRLRAQVATRRKGGPKVVGFVPIGSSAKLHPRRGTVEVEGYAYVTGFNIKDKTCERFFYAHSEPGERPQPMRLARPWEELLSDWHSLIDSYKAGHDDLECPQTTCGRVAAESERIGDDPGQPTCSAHIHDPQWTTLTPGSFCYALEGDDGVCRLYPVLIPRDLYRVSPRDLLDESLAPAACFDELSPADRVFGWVAPQGSGVRPSGYRGRLRIGPVTCDDDASAAVERFPGDGLALAILSNPKPQQGRFYLAESKERPDLPVPDRTAKEELYSPGRGLRGRKAYWHHTGLDAERHWRPDAGDADLAQAVVGGRFREYLRSWAPINDKGDLTPDRRRYATKPHEEQRDSQNLSVEGWVKPGTTFRFTIEVRDLDEFELGALAWVLSLPDGHFHRLGLGRPLGFGSVRLAIDPRATRLHRGEAYAEYYRSLSATLADTDPIKEVRVAKERFEEMVQGSPELRAVRDAMLAAAKGDPSLPVHYPRVRPKKLAPGAPTPPDPRGRNFAWFTQNERLSGKDIAKRRGRSLPRAADADPPLTIYLTRSRVSALEESRCRRSANF